MQVNRRKIVDTIVQNGGKKSSYKLYIYSSICETSSSEDNNIIYQPVLKEALNFGD